MKLHHVSFYQFGPSIPPQHPVSDTTYCRDKEEVDLNLQSPLRLHVTSLR